MTLPGPVAAVAVLAQPSAAAAPARLGPPSVTEPGGTVLVADGQLQDALITPHWSYAVQDGSFAVFADRRAAGMLSLQPAAGQTGSGATVRRAAGTPANPTAAAVSSRRGVRVIRSVAATAGWTATWHPDGGPAVALAVRRDGLVQAVGVPAGRGVVTWTYRPPGFRAGAALSLAAVLLIAGLAVAAARGRSRRRPATGLRARGVRRSTSGLPRRGPQSAVRANRLSLRDTKSG